MRTAILSVLLAALCYGADEPKPQVPPPAQDKPVATTVKPESLSPVIPIGVQPGEPANPGKMAAPAPPAGGTAPGSLPVSRNTYIIGAEDDIRVMVWGHPDVTGDFRVRPDGMISVLLIGEIQAAGKTPQELESDITGKVKEFIKDPRVSVGLLAVHSKKYYINGEVNKPGSYDLAVPTNVLEALVNAGGFKDFADEKHIRIMRGSTVYMFNYKLVSKGQKSEQNIQLQPGDQIFVK
jgi:polysaccharide export outer membrane protein